ncbi:MAG: TRASH domain-containing protein [Planctomycetaceae bacterium]|nr:TRASH domain-containing protein [Planctomycetaceae bacterium]
MVSGGLGTATVSFEGKTYYVCCSGCSAAFNEEPERWIAKALEEAKKKP